MRVNICYSVELEEIPEVVNGLFKEVSCRLVGVSDRILEQEHLLRDGNSIAHAASIAAAVDDARTALTDFDRRLHDLMSIYAGYYQALTNPEETLAKLNEGGETVQENAEQLQQVASELEDAQQQLFDEVAEAERAHAATGAPSVSTGEAHAE